MPPRLVVAAVIAGWLAAVGWLAHDKWLPWLRPADEPAFVVEMADEVAPEHAVWTIYRKDQRIGGAETRFAARKDGLFEVTTRLRDLEVSYGDLVRCKLPVFAITRHVTRQGDLVTLDARGVMQVFLFPTETKFDVTIRGRVDGDRFVGECELDNGGTKTTSSLEPINVVSTNAFSPLQLGQKYPSLKPGQTWRATNIDSIGDAIEAGVRQAAKNRIGKTSIGLPDSLRPPELLAQVQADTEDVTHRGKTYTCRVIVFQAGRVRSRTWVDVADGRVVRQEAAVYGDVLVLQRD